MIYPIRTIVAGIADLDAGDLVLGGAIELARQTSARLHLVHGFELPSLAWDAYGRMGYVDAQTLDDHAESLRKLLERAVAGCGRIEGIHYHMIPVGSVAEAAIRDCAANVLVIPARAEEQRELPVQRTKGTDIVAAPRPN